MIYQLGRARKLLRAVKAADDLPVEMSVTVASWERFDPRKDDSTQFTRWYHSQNYVALVNRKEKMFCGCIAGFAEVLAAQEEVSIPTEVIFRLSEFLDCTYDEASKLFKTPDPLIAISRLETLIRTSEEKFRR